MRWSLSMLVLLCSCEANPPQFYAIPDASAEVADPYGDTEPCTVVVDQSVAAAAKACLKHGPGSVPIGNGCMTSGYAWKACKALSPLACYRLSAGACVLCVQPEAWP